MGRFIEVSIDQDALAAGQAEALVRSCPVDVFAIDSAAGLVAVAENEDECILCGRCVELAPAAIAVRRAYGERRQLTVTAGALDG
jgi:NAD-dependent dihydropyrimidine dehydrogenase PreA subunit